MAFILTILRTMIGVQFDQIYFQISPQTPTKRIWLRLIAILVIISEAHTSPSWWVGLGKGILRWPYQIIFCAFWIIEHTQKCKLFLTFTTFHKHPHSFSPHLPHRLPLPPLTPLPITLHHHPTHLSPSPFPFTISTILPSTAPLLLHP